MVLYKQLQLTANDTHTRAHETGVVCNTRGEVPTVYSSPQSLCGCCWSSAAQMLPVTVSLPISTSPSRPTRFLLLPRACVYTCVPPPNLRGPAHHATTSPTPPYSTHHTVLRKVLPTVNLLSLDRICVQVGCR